MVAEGEAKGKAKRRYLIFTMEEGKKLPRIPMRSWTFVVVVGALLALMSIIDRGGLSTAPAAAPASADPAVACSVTVNTSTLNVRAEPTVTSAQVQQLLQGVDVAATTTVVGGFRELSEGHWAQDQYLTPVPGATCG